jgi:hypothetical protein
MAKYKKKSVEVVDAFRLGYDDMPKWFREHYMVGEIIQERRPNGNIYAYISGLGGTKMVNKGDYVVRDNQDELYVYSANVFDATYDKIKGE